jgi:hypothetical protein
MPGTPDAKHGERYEDVGIVFEDLAPGSEPTEPGGLRYVDGSLIGRDATGTFDLRSGSGLSEAQHRVLRQLIHFIDNGPAEGFTSGAYRETLPSASAFPTSIIWWESSGKTKKIVEKLITYTGAFPTTIEWNIYDTDGSTKLATVSDAISYTGAFETSRTRTITVY